MTRLALGIVIALFSSCQLCGQAALSQKGYAQITGVSIAPPPFTNVTGPGRTWLDVRIAVQKANASNPTLHMGFQKYNSFPPAITPEITPDGLIVTLSGPATIHVRVCTSNELAGQLKVSAAIVGVGPEKDYFVKEPDSATVADITVPGPAQPR